MYGPLDAVYYYIIWSFSTDVFAWSLIIHYLNQGFISVEIGVLSNHIQFHLSFNSFIGIVPTELEQLRNIYSVLLKNNQLSGTTSFLLCLLLRCLLSSQSVAYQATLNFLLLVISVQCIVSKPVACVIGVLVIGPTKLSICHFDIKATTKTIVP
jgi:hypothetical protein